MALLGGAPLHIGSASYGRWLLVTSHQHLKNEIHRCTTIILIMSSTSYGENVLESKWQSHTACFASMFATNTTRQLLSAEKEIFFFFFWFNRSPLKPQSCLLSTIRLMSNCICFLFVCLKLFYLRQLTRPQLLSVIVTKHPVAQQTRSVHSQ